MPKIRKNELSFWSSADRERFNKNVVLLSILNKVPKKPTKHHLRERSKGTSGNGIQEGLASRTLLPVNEESHIAEALAFTTVMCDDRNAIMAVCIEQHAREPGLTFRIAANSGDLSKVAQGLVKMGSVLEQAAQRGSYHQRVAQLRG